MNDLNIEKTADSPQVICSLQGQLSIEGRAIPEDPFSFWQPILEWVRDYKKQPSAQTTLTIYLDYVNSSSSMYINEILRQLDAICLSGKNVQVVWKHDDDDDTLPQLGNDLAALVSIPFTFEKVNVTKERLQKVHIKSKKSGRISIISQKYWDAVKRNGHGGEYEVQEENA